MSEPTEEERALLRRQRLYNDETFSDVTICYSGRKVHAHKAILSLASEYFHRAFSGSFKEATAKEFHLYEDKPEAVTDMLRHIYGLGNIHLVSWKMTSNIELMIAADKYNVPTLYASSKAHAANILGILKNTTGRLGNGLKHVRIIYECGACDQKLRRLAAGAFQGDLKAWMKGEKFRQLLLDIPQVSLDLLSIMADKAA